jgi:hypothetical protein
MWPFNVIVWHTFSLTILYAKFPFMYWQVAPFNTHYPQLQEHLMQVGVDPALNKWDQPFVLGTVDPHDSLSHPAGVSDVKAESAACLDPDLFTNFLVCQLDLIFSLETSMSTGKDIICGFNQSATCS